MCGETQACGWSSRFAAMLRLATVVAVALALTQGDDAAMGAVRAADRDGDGTLGHDELMRVIELAQRHRHRHERRAKLGSGLWAKLEAQFLSMAVPAALTGYVFPSAVARAAPGQRAALPSAVRKRLDKHHWRFADADADGRLDLVEFAATWGWLPIEEGGGSREACT